MASTSYQVGRGATIGVVETAHPTGNVLTASAAAKGATSITLTAAATETATLENGDLLAFDANLTAKVTAAATVTDAGVAVTVQPLDAAFAGSETSTFRDYNLLIGTKQLNYTPTRGNIDVGTLEDWANKSYIPDLLDTTIDVGDLQIIAGNTAQDLVRDYHVNNKPDCLYWQIVYRNGFVVRFAGFTTGALPFNAVNEGAVISGSMTIQVSGDVTTENVYN